MQNAAQQHYLQQMVERSSAELLGRAQGGKPLDGVLFLGNPQLVFPALLYDDPLLEPVDWAVWVAIKRYAADGNTVTAIPSYDELMRRSHVGSRATIARSISILRATRWLTVCRSRVRDPGGRIKGSIYALHDEPLQLAGSLVLDTGYLQWMEETAQGRHNPHPRAIAVASNLLRDLHDQIRDGVAVEQPEEPMGRRMLAMQYLADRAHTRDVEGRFYAASSRSVNAITSRAYLKKGGKTGGAHPSTVSVLSAGPIPSTETVPTPSTVSVPIPSTVSVPLAHAGSSSNSSLTLKGEDKRNTTTTLPNSSGKGDKGDGTETVLAYPSALGAADRKLVGMHMGNVPAQHRQPVLDALGAKLAAIAAGTTAPLNYGVMPYFRRLCQLAVTGRLNPATAAPKAPPKTPHQSVQPCAAANDGNALAVAISNLTAEIGGLDRLARLAKLSGQDMGLAAKRAELAGLQQRYRDLQQQPQQQVAH